MALPPVLNKFFALKGGLNLQKPALELYPGLCIDSQNYEPSIDGGYRRIDGFEAYDGQASPTAASYWLIPIVKTGIVIVGDTLTGATSGATFKVLSLTSDIDGYVVAGRLTGTLTSSENLRKSGVTVAHMNGSVLQNGAQSMSADADYALLAANDWRTLIGKVPGSGPIRGVCVYKDVVYAFRDNAGGTAGAMYKATASGWQQVTFGTEIQFSSGLAAGPIVAGDTITGGTSGATATVVTVLTRAGSWSNNNAVGTLIITPVSGTWQNAESIKVGGTDKATTASLATAITRQPGGKLEFYNFNFTGSSSTGLKMYLVDGVNLCAEFDGTNYIPIRTGMATDTPNHVIGYKGYLILAFQGSVQFSGLTLPYSWTAVLGAGEFSTGDPVTGFLPNGGSGSTGSALTIFTAGKTFTLYGSSTLNFTLVNTVDNIGYRAYTSQLCSNTPFGFTARGIQTLITTLQYGDFDFSSVSHDIQPIITARMGLETCSTTLKAKNHYKLFFSDNTALVVGLTGDKVNGIMPLNYGIPVRCIVTSTLSSGTEVTYFGSDDGYVYQDGVGTSFNGGNIEAWLRLPFFHAGSPRMRKRWMRCVMELFVERYFELSATYDLGYGSSQVQPSDPMPANALVGGGGYWDSQNFYWEQFNWDADIISAPTISLNGTAINISMLFYSNSDRFKSHTLQGMTMFWINRRNER